MIAKIIDKKTIHVFDKTQFDWYQIRNCGQIFCDPPCEITELDDRITIKATGEKNSECLWNYFDLDCDYNEIKRELLKFDFLKKPVEAGFGIRILRQPFIPTLISFIISANNNIKRFTKTIAQIDFDNLKKYTENDFKKMGCGYRAPYLVKTIALFDAFPVESELEKMNNPELRKHLMSLSGVGRKVADCIMLFAFHRLDVAPVDTWIQKALAGMNENEKNLLFNNKLAGVAQQYIFYYLQHLREEL